MPAIQRRKYGLIAGHLTATSPEVHGNTWLQPASVGVGMVSSITGGEMRLSIPWVYLCRGA
jgi:hypothetical protein